MKNILKKDLLLVLITLFSFSCAEKAPEPYGALPTPDQMAWQKMEYYMFIHFGPNTFTDVEWGDGKEDPKVFNPSDLDCRQWAATAKAAGMKGIILTAKHHDGFCLWPSKYSTHTVRESLWKDGKGDLLRELSDACKEYGLKFGVYLSPWDQNHPAYGTDEYNQVFANTLNEVLSNYGEVFEQWFDGANGGSEGGKKQVYDWNLFHETVYRNQPHAIIFSDVGPGCRWMGNERGVAGVTNWSTMNIEGFEPGHGAPPTNILTEGEIGGKAWVPAETDVSIRPGWFYSPSTDENVKSVEQLMNIYYTSIGRNSNLLLNVPPDRRGRIHPTDSTRLMEFRRAVEETFKQNLISDAGITASATRKGFDPKNLLDDNFETYWAAPDSTLTPALEVSWTEEKELNRLLIQEYIPLGQRVSSIKVKYWNNEKNEWNDLTQGTTIGYKRILRFPTVRTNKLQIELEALACPLISTIGIFNAPESPEPLVIKRDKEGIVSIESQENSPIYYTLDGSNPTEASTKYEKPFALPLSGTVKAIVKKEGFGSVITASFGIAPTNWTILSPSGNPAKVIDADKNTYELINKNTPLVINLQKEYALVGFSYTPAPDTSAPNIARYNLFVSTDGKKWVPVKENAIFNNIKNNPIEQYILFNKVSFAKYIKLEPVELTTESSEYTVAELGIIT
ncbi:MAG: alpha-L-fucosidase [Dysgonomonas sp.]|nr:alpha-L-fucosidase [Dysgonomonas sp.]